MTGKSIWSGRRDSNPLPTAWEAVALPGELLPLIFILKRTAEKQSAKPASYFLQE